MTLNRDSLRVEKAAIRTNEGQVFTVDPPKRHHDVIRAIRESGYEGPVCGDRQGFVLNDGRFVMRKAALRVAIKAEQARLDKCIAPGIGLFSEDIW
jgi:hypothetical protein